MKSVLFLCTANYYRSRFAEILFNHLAEQEQLPWRAISRGLTAELARHHGPICSYTLDRLRSLGIPYDDDPRYPIQVTEADLKAADLVIAVKEAEHRAMFAKRFPAWEDRVEYWRIDDLDCAQPEEALPKLQAEIHDLVARLARGGTDVAKTAA